MGKYKVLYTSFGWKEVTKRGIVRRDSSEGDIITMPDDHPAVIEGLKFGKFEKIEETPKKK